ncbi:MAG: DUF5985 family protein [Tahibacter sp.]
MSSVVYGLCALTALLCAVLLLRAYWASRSPVLLWSGLCFLGLTVSNIVLVLDKLVYPQFDLLPWRLWITVIALGLLIFGLIHDEQ